jgi:NitT/TauT family transport system ATP-binding protein
VGVSSDRRPRDPRELSAGGPGGAAGKGIRIRTLSKTYLSGGREVHALGPLDMDIGAGEFLSVVGPSGCGKSTLLLLVAGLLRPTSGDVWIGDARLEGPFTDVGIVFQDHLLLDFRTALGNVLLQTQIRGLPKAASASEARRLLRRLGLAGAEDRYPHQLSGGMRQRVSLARALIHGPSVLLMDEPFGALDAITRTQMRHDLERLWLDRRCTVVFITHDVEEAVGLSDRIVVMSPSPGRIVEEIRVDLPRPRPIELGRQRNFVDYVDRVYAIFRSLGVLTAE